MDLQRLSDQIEIAALLSSYARAVDSEDWTLWKSLFTADAVIDYRSAGGICGSREEVADWLAASMCYVPMKQHYITNIEAEVSADDARVRAMFYNPMQLPGKAELSFCGGYYHHTMVRTETGWCSSSMLEESLWFVNPLTAEQLSEHEGNA